MIKKYCKSILILLVVTLLFIPLFSVEAEYFTGYLDFDLNNSNNITKNRINTDYAFFVENKTQNNLYYALKYDSDQSKYDNLQKEQFWLDRSILMKNFSQQSKYLKAKYNNAKVIYGRYHFQIDSPMFSNYYNNSIGLKFAYTKKNRSFNIFSSRTGQISITDKIFNPSYSIIFLNNENVLQQSEMIYVNTLNKDNEVLSRNYLRKSVHYEIDYLNGKIIFDPLIYFLNQPEYNHELIINYKIKGNGVKYFNRGYNLKTKLTQNTDLKIYEVSEENQKDLNGLVLSISPKDRKYYKLEYQSKREKKMNLNVSNNNGTSYLQNVSNNNRTEKIGIRYLNEINTNNKIQGHSYKTIIKTPKMEEVNEIEHYIKINNTLNEKINSEIIYRRLDNSLNQNYYQYQSTINSQINQKLILDTKFKYVNGTSNVTKEKSLDNFFTYKYSEYLDISWGYLHNMPKELYYGQYEVRYRPKYNSHIIFGNRVINTQYREKRFEYKMTNGIKLFKTTQEKLIDQSIVNKSNGLKYKINPRSSISFIDSTHRKEVNVKENIVKYKLNLNKHISGGLNQRTYYTNLNGGFQKKRVGIKVSLNIEKKGHIFVSSLDKEKNLSETFRNERLKLSYHKRDNSKLYFFTGFEKEIKKDKVKNIDDVFSKLKFKVKYRPFSNRHNLSYSYLKQKMDTKNLSTDSEKYSLYQTLGFSYYFNQKVSLNTSFSKWEKRLKTNNRTISNVILLKRIGLNYRFKESWSMNGEYRNLEKINEEGDSGYLVSVRKNLNKKISMGIEYNFTDFNNDLSNLSYDNKGLTFNINYKW
ncbi:MAG: hypothetical protein K9K76_03895 [Halanaerobiales bacterium]|nr:hypothetical protein [Halanaerobiales bacterium]